MGGGGGGGGGGGEGLSEFFSLKSVYLKISLNMKRSRHAKKSVFKEKEKMEIAWTKSKSF